MARSNFGGAIDQLTVAADAGLGGALKAAPDSVLDPLYNKAKSDGTRIVVTDFLIDPEYDGTYTASSTIPTDADGYAVPFQGPDGLTRLWDLDGRFIDANDKDAAINSASTTAPGIVELATTSEAAAGSSATLAVTPAGLEARVDAHDADTNSHADVRAIVDQNSTAILSKADLVGGTVPPDQLATSTSPDADSLALRTATGALTGADATSDEELVPLLQLRTEITDAAALGTEVRAGTEGAVPISLTSTSVYVALADADMTVTDAASGSVYDFAPTIIYRGSTADDIKVRFKSNTAAATNKLTNPSFETNTTGWSSGPAASAIGRGTTGGFAADGTAYGTITALQAGTGTTWTSQLVPATAGSVWTAAVEARTITGTPRQQRIDIQFMDATGNSAVSTVLGTATTINSSTWTRCLSNAATLLGSTAPSGTFYVRMRIITMAQAVNDVTGIDKAQLEPVAPIPVYGATGGGGSSALTIVGCWDHLPVGATAALDPTVRTVMRTSASDIVTAGSVGATTDACLTGVFRVTVGGTGLTDQLIGLEAATTGTSTSIVYADSTIARVG